MGLLYRLQSGRLVTSFLALGLSGSLLVFAAPSPVVAGVPDPTLSTVPNVLTVPGGTLPYAVTIVGSSGPLANANVTLVYSAAANAALCWCTGQTHPSISATTNASGVATFNISSGGCANPATISGGVAVEVFVNSVKLKEVGQVSPDYVNSLTPPCLVSLADAVQFTPPLAQSIYGFCFDLNSSLTVGLADAVIATPYFANGTSCN